MTAIGFRSCAMKHNEFAVRCHGSRQTGVAGEMAETLRYARAARILRQGGNPRSGLSLLCRSWLVGARGFEPPTTSPPAKCATRLRYAPNVRIITEQEHMSTSKTPDLRASATRIACLPHFIPTAALHKKFLAYISSICGAAKFFASSRYTACLLTPFPRLAFG